MVVSLKELLSMQMIMKAKINIDKLNQKNNKVWANHQNSSLFANLQDNRWVSIQLMMRLHMQGEIKIIISQRNMEKLDGWLNAATVEESLMNKP